MRRSAASLIALSLLVAPAFAQSSEGVVREGAGSRRASLNAMELKPFASDLWSGIGAWANGSALTSGETSGKPVLVVTWASWYPTSVRALPAAQRLADQYGDKGLIVVGLHDNEGWEDAESVAKDRGITFRLAHDKDNAFRAAMMVDQDPDIYVIDRAGQLRFADVDAASLEQAVAIVVKESAEDAAKINQTLADRAAAERVKAQSTAAINQKVDLAAIPDLPLPDIDPMRYASPDLWPKVKDNNGRDQQPSVLNLPGDGYYPPKTPVTKGRAVIMYYWNPDMPATARMVREMDLLQRERGRDVTVIGAVVPADRLGRSSSSSESEADKALAVERLGKRTEEFARSSRLNHSIVYDPIGSTMSFEGSSSFQGSMTIAAVASSDGIIRWWGDAKSPSFKAAVEKVLANDPGIAARRGVEAAWLKARGK